MTSSIDFSKWTAATTDLNWGVQRTLHDTLRAVAYGNVKMVWGADSWDGSPCLINAVANMISDDVTKVSPAGWFPAVVSAFDEIGRALREQEVNTDHLVSPLAAEILLANFGPLKPVPTAEDFLKVAAENLINLPYREPSDDEFADMLAEAKSVPAPSDVVDEVISADALLKADQERAEQQYPLSHVRIPR